MEWFSLSWNNTASSEVNDAPGMGDEHHHCTDSQYRVIAHVRHNALQITVEYPFALVSLIFQAKFLPN